MATSKTADLGIGLPSTASLDQILGKRKRDVSAAAAVLAGSDVPIKTLEAFFTGWSEIDGKDSDMIKAVVEELGSLRYLEKYRKKNPEEDIVAIALSGLDKYDLLRLNAKVNVAVPFADWEFVMKTVFDLKDTRVLSHDQIIECWDQNAANLIDRLGVIKESVANNPEPVARMLIDPVLLLIAETLNKSATAASALFAELPISKGGDHPTSVRWVGPDGTTYTTFLTGRVDYLLLVFQSLAQKDAEAAKSAVDDAKASRKASLRSFVTDKGIRAVWSFDLGSNLQALVFEAKVEEAKKLIEHLPQVVGECVVTMDVTKRSAVPWCLTTGETWIFGHAMTMPGGTGYTIHHAEPISWNAEHKTGEQGDVLKQAFKILAYWTTMAPVEVRAISAAF